MEVSYERNLNHAYLVIGMEWELDMESYQARMLLGGGVKELLSCQVQSVNGLKELCFEITARESIASMCQKGKLREKELKRILQGILHVVTQLQAFLMDGNQLLLQPEYIYFDPREETFQFCYLPGYEKDLQGQLCQVLEYLLPVIEHEDSNAVSMGYGIYRECLAESFSIEQIKEHLYKEQLPEPEPAEQEAEMDPERQKAFQEFFEEMDEEKMEEKDFVPWSTVAISALWTVVLLGIGGLRLLGYLSFLTFPMMLGIFILILGILWVNMRVLSREEGKMGQLFVKRRKKTETSGGGTFSQGNMAQASIQWPGKKVVEPEEVRKIYTDEDYQRETRERDMVLRENPGDETVALAFGNTMPLPKIQESRKVKLISQNPQALSDIELTGDLTVIGKQRETVDAVIPIPTVSRVHAKIRRMEEEYYLMDLNSLNGTCLNGRAIPPQENCRMNPGDQVTFADADYVFVL